MTYQQHSSTPTCKSSCSVISALSQSFQWPIGSTVLVVKMTLAKSWNEVFIWYWDVKISALSWKVLSHAVTKSDAWQECYICERVIYFALQDSTATTLLQLTLLLSYDLQCSLKIFPPNVSIADRLKIFHNFVHQPFFEVENISQFCSSTFLWG
jgi:hypothetical protein